MKTKIVKIIIVKVIEIMLYTLLKIFKFLKIRQFFEEMTIGFSDI